MWERRSTRYHLNKDDDDDDDDDDVSSSRNASYMRLAAVRIARSRQPGRIRWEDQRRAWNSSQVEAWTWCLSPMDHGHWRAKVQVDPLCN